MNSKIDRDGFGQLAVLKRRTNNMKKMRELEQENATLRAENAHLKNALALADALRNKERNLPK